MKRCVVLLILWMLADPSLSKAGSRDVNDLVSQCGINSLYVCMKRLGIEPSLDQLYSEVKTDPNNNVSLRQLTACAQTHKMAVTAIERPNRAKIDRYLKESSCVIFQFTEEKVQHIAALMKFKSGQVWYVDPPARNAILKDDDIADLCAKSGGMLILSMAPEAGLQIVSESPLLARTYVPAIVLGCITVLATIFLKWIKNRRRSDAS